MEKIAIYGGSFSPPHLGHYRALAAFMREILPHTTLVIPAFLPPHKQLSGNATPEQRLHMCRLAFADLPVTVSDMEIARGGKSYTVLTLEELSRPGRELSLLCGTDMFLTLDSWHMPNRLFELAEIVYVRREGGTAGESALQAMRARAEEYRARYRARIRELACESTEISSTELRRRIAAGEDTADYLHPDVKEYIDRCRLYR